MRLKRAGVPVEHRAARTKPEIALAEIDRVIASGVRFGCVLADSGTASAGLPSGAHDTRRGLGRRYPSSPEGLSGVSFATL